MKEIEFKNIVKKYTEGHSSLEEEQLLFNNTKSTEHELEAWFTFAKDNKKKTPKNFNETLWESFSHKKNRKQKTYIGVFSAAASIILLLSIYSSNSKQKELQYSEKVALLEQAIHMTSYREASEVPKNIYYEDDMLMVYTTTK